MFDLSNSDWIVDVISKIAKSVFGPSLWTSADNDNEIYVQVHAMWRFFTL